MKLVGKFNENFVDKQIDINSARKFFALEDKFRKNNYKDLECITFFSKYYCEFGLTRHFAMLLDDAVSSGQFIKSLDEITDVDFRKMFINALSCIFDTESEINNYLSNKINIQYEQSADYWK